MYDLAFIYKVLLPEIFQATLYTEQNKKKLWQFLPFYTENIMNFKNYTFSSSIATLEGQFVVPLSFCMLDVYLTP